MLLEKVASGDRGMPLSRVISDRRPEWWQSLLWAVAFSAVSWAFRALVGPLLLTEAPYEACFPAVLAATVWGGRLGGVATALLSGFLANRAFVSGPHQLDAPHLWSVLIFFVVASFVIILADTMAAAVRREAALRAKMEVIGRELQHRAKNGMTVVIALIQQTGRTATSVDDFQSKLIDRFHALARAQTVLDESSGGPASLKALIDEVLGPFDTGGRITGDMVGSDVGISRDTAVGLCLVLHELATNATKYGALSVPAGSVGLRWTISKRKVSMLWQERGGPLVESPTRTGFGTRLFKRVMPDGSVAVSFEPNGVRADIEFLAQDDASQKSRAVGIDHRANS
jgi:two-component sensor histidine kinase